MSAPVVSGIRVYPIKSLDPVELQRAEIGMQSLRYDREFALLASDGGFINGKRTGRVNELRAEYDLAEYTVHLMPRESKVVSTFHLLNDKLKLEKYLCEFFNTEVSLVHNQEGRLMDIPDVSSITVVSEASLASLYKDLPERTLEDMRLRFRTNIEISGVEPFWEEQLIGEPGIGMRFTIGDVEAIGVSTRARCNVPPRDPMTGVLNKTFIKRMMKSSESSLPLESQLPAYGNLYHLTINCYVSKAQTGKWIQVGDAVKIIESVKLA